MKRILLVAASALALAVPAHSAVIFTDNFDSENGGNSQLNYTGFANFTVTGQVDLVKSGTYGITCSGSCVDLDGTTGPGALLSSGVVAFSTGDTLILSFDIGGDQRNGVADDWYAEFVTSLGTFGTYGNLVNATDPFATQTFVWTATGSGTAKFSIGTTSADKVGPLLDNVSLAIRPVVPEPATWAMMIGGFALAGASLRRRKASVRFA